MSIGGDRDFRKGPDAAELDEEEDSEKKAAELKMNAARHKRFIARKAARDGGVGAENETPPVQMKGATDGQVPAEAVHAAADSGLRGANAPLPHGDKIQEAFGDHDVRGVRAAVGGSAAKANEQMGSHAFARGDQIAFRQSPDLHTAAHEAAHAVQQRAGAAPAGGVGHQGDAHEHHADEVASRVVSGQSAKPLLDKMVGSGASRGSAAPQAPVRFLAGNVQGTAAMPQLGGQQGESVADAAQRMHPGARDANFNPARKVEFEGKLSAAILRNPAPFEQAVHFVSQKILAYVDQKCGAGTQKGIEELNKLQGGAEYFGRMSNEIMLSQQEFAGQIRRVLGGGAGSIPNHLMAHQVFKSDILDKDWEAKIAQTLLQKGATDPAFIRQQTQANVGGQQINPLDKDQRGRVAPGAPGSAIPGPQAIPTVPEASGINAGAPGQAPAGTNPGGETAGGERAGTEQSHQRGVDRWTMDEGKAFIQQARLELDMPLAAGASGSTADLMNCAMTLGLPQGPQMLQYGLGVLGFLGSAGAHSFHEIMTVCEAAGIPYVPGNYRGVYPPEFEATPEFQQLKQEYSDLLGDPNAAAAPPPAQGGAQGGAAPPPPQAPR